MFYSADICIISKAKQGSQVQILLEHLPSLSRIQCDHIRHYQYIQRFRHSEPSPMVEEHIHHCHLRPRRYRSPTGNQHLDCSSSKKVQ